MRRAAGYSLRSKRARNVSDTTTVRSVAAAGLGSVITDLRRVAGGDLNDAYAARLADNRVVFLKTSDDAAPGSYAAEAAGLRWIASAAGAPPVPDVLAVVDPPGRDRRPRMLALSWVEPGRLSSGGEEKLGQGLAALHQAGASGYCAAPPGAPPGLRIGPLELPAGSVSTWAEAYGTFRLRPLARRAAASGALTSDGLAAVERVCERLPELAGPSEPPARLHGDLWGGNVLANTNGVPYLIDPAAYGGHREMDLAMLHLFGGTSERCFSAYAEAFPLADGHRERVKLWQLFPLLVHTVLFGGGYGERVAAIARRYTG
jgi:fructosamine-3-kinase